jgi:hypothetical protein
MLSVELRSFVPAMVTSPCACSPLVIFFPQVCDDTVLMERIIGRGADLPEDERRPDDNFQTALQRLRTFHKYHHQTMEWLREAHIPIVNLDCSGSPNSVWSQLQAIGRLMRPAVKIPAGSLGAGSATAGKKE